MPSLYNIEQTRISNLPFLAKAIVGGVIIRCLECLDAFPRGSGGGRGGGVEQELEEIKTSCGSTTGTG